MRKRTLYVALAFFIAALVGMGLYLMKPSQEDEASYFSLIELSNRSYGDQSNAVSFTSTQVREKVRKDLYIPNGDTQLHIRVEGKTSEVEVKNAPRNPVLIEQLKEVVGWMQEEVFYLLPNGKKVGALNVDVQENMEPYQIVRIFQADEGVLDYSKGVLSADQVKMKQVRLPGHTLPETVDPENQNVLIQGTADSIRVSMKEKITLEAKRFRATLYHMEDKAR